MKFLVASGFRPNSMELSCVAELRNLGHEVVEFRTQAGRLARTVLLNRLSRRAMNRRLVEITKAERPDVVMTINGKDIDPRTVEALSHEARTVNWWVDLPFLYPQWRRFLHLYDDVFVSVKRTHWFDGIQNARTLYPAVDATYVVGKQEPRQYMVSFVGTHYRGRASFLKHVQAQTPAILNMFSDLPLDRMLQVYRQSAIGLNVHQDIDTANRTMINLRSFEIPASACAQLVDYREEVEDCFRLWKEVWVYDGVKDLAGSICYLLDNPTETAKMAQAGNRRVRKQHTYEHRMRTLVRELRRR